MVNKCAAYGCTSGYKRKRKTLSEGSGTKVTFHAFPLHDKELCEKWVRAKLRKDFVPSKHSKLCSLHFKPSDFVETHQDSNKSRQRTRDDEKLQRRHLKTDAVPSVFPSAPDYLSASSSAPGTTVMATSGSRQQREAERAEELEKAMVEEDDVSDLTTEELASRIRQEELGPQGFTVSIVDDMLLIYLICIVDNIPTITASICVKSDHSVIVTMDRKVVPASQYKDIIQGQLKLMSQLTNLMARVKACMVFLAI